jgi:hypothetical protein
MLIRQTKTRNDHWRSLHYLSPGCQQVRQRTLLNLGRNFTRAKDEWLQLCTRIEQIFSGQGSLLPESAAIENLAQRYAARLVASRPSIVPEPEISAAEHQDADVNTWNCLVSDLSGLSMLGWQLSPGLGVTDLPDSIGMNAGQCACALGSIVGRVACPRSELATWRGLQDKCAFGELVDVDFEEVPRCSSI